MSRSDGDALDDIAAAITSIRSHLQHGPISVEIVMDAVAMRLLEIGEAVKALSTETTDTEPQIRWREIAGTAAPAQQEASPPRASALTPAALVGTWKGIAGWDQKTAIDASGHVAPHLVVFRPDSTFT